MQSLHSEKTITLAGATNYSGEEKRWKVLVCTTQAIQFAKFIEILASNIPEGARIVRSCYDEILDELSFILESEDFDLVKPDKVIPIHHAAFVNTRKDCSTCQYSHAFSGILRCFNDNTKIGQCPQPFYCSEFKPATEDLDV